MEKDAENIIYKVTSTQLPAIVGGALADIFTKGHIREPHWHPNAWELDVVVSGEAQISVIDPNTNKLHNYIAKPGQVVFTPMAWWHWIIPKSEKLHMHLFFNNDQFETALASNMLRLTPVEVYQMSYGINANKIADVLCPIKEGVEIGPPTAEAHRPFTHNTVVGPKENQKQKIIEINFNGKNYKI